jgi:predicted AAA+ superfamily ATPase
LIKSPKLYFLDSGLLCSLLGIRSAEALDVHASRGAIFETFVLAELMKSYAHRGRRPPLFFWRDSAGHEIDFLLDHGTRATAIEAKSAQTSHPSFFDGLLWWRGLVENDRAPAMLVFGGEPGFRFRGIPAVSWSQL